jgi:hypothetical protein
VASFSRTRRGKKSLSWEALREGAAGAGGAGGAGEEGAGEGETSASLAATSFVVDSSLVAAAAALFASFLAALAAFLASRFSRNVILASPPCCRGVDWLAPMAAFLEKGAKKKKVRKRL